MKKKMPRPDPQEFEKLLQELEDHRGKSDRNILDSEYLNPWNLGKKKPSGKTIISAKLPKELP